MRVLVQALVAAPGGSVTVLRDLLAAWPDGDELLVVCWRPEAAQLLSDTGHEVVRVPARSTPEALLRLRLTPPHPVRTFRPEVVWSQAVHVGGIHAPQAVHWRDIGSFADVHALTLRQRVKRRREARDVLRADLRIFNSVAMRHAAQQSYPGIARLPTAVIPNGLDLTELLATAGPTPPTGRPLRILLPQMDAPHKRNELAIDAVALLDADPPSPFSSVELVIAGTGAYRGLRAHVARSDVAASVSYAGYVPRAHMAELYAACDVVLISSAGESFCNPAIEAAAAGRPLASSPLEVLEETGGPLAVLASGHAAADLAAAVRSAALLGHDPAARARAQEHARRFTAQRRAMELRQRLADLSLSGPDVDR